VSVENPRETQPAEILPERLYVGSAAQAHNWDLLNVSYFDVHFCMFVFCSTTKHEQNKYAHANTRANTRSSLLYFSLAGTRTRTHTQTQTHTRAHAHTRTQHTQTRTTHTFPDVNILCAYAHVYEYGKIFVLTTYVCLLSHSLLFLRPLTGAQGDTHSQRMPGRQPICRVDKLLHVRPRRHSH